MGYDMYIVAPSDQMLRQAAENEKRFDELIAARDKAEGEQRDLLQRQVEDNWPTDPAYFRLNIWGMQKYRQAMFARDMAFEAQHLPWPKYPGDEHFDGNDEPIDSEALNYELELQHVRTWKPEHPGIPLFKFGSNDGWVVTPDECREAIKADAQYSDLPFETDDENNYWREWIDFLSIAAEHEGFKVW